MNRTIKPALKINGTLTVPGDKSISHRALMLGAICSGKVAVTGLSTAADCQSTAACLKSLGVEIWRSGENTIIEGKGLSGLREPLPVLDAQNSGTTIRLMSGLLAGQSFNSVITGDSSLCNRPMKRIIEPLTKMGAAIFGRAENSKPPLMIIGKELKAIEYTLPVASAQVKSAILLAGLYCRDKTVVIEKMPSRDHTERLINYLGGKVQKDNGLTSISTGELRGKDIYVPGDISSALYFIVAALMSRDSHVTVQNIGLNPTRTGAIAVLQEMGADIKISQTVVRCSEPNGTIEAASSELHGIDIGPEMIPSLIDEIPILTLAATQAIGKTTIRGAGELRVKESDRLANIAVGLNAMGADISQTDDGLVITGPTPLTGTMVGSSFDHRMAMTFAIAGLIAEGQTVIEDSDCVSISFPDFFQKVDWLTDGGNVEPSR